MFHAIGLVEFSSIAKGIEASDVMAKTAEVRILVSKAICPGKYIVLVGGDIAAVQQSVRSATALDGPTVVDHFLIPNIHPSIMPAIGGGNSIGEVLALGIIEMFTEKYGVDAGITGLVNSREIFVVPMANPDGGEYDVASGAYRYWRKYRTDQ